MKNKKQFVILLVVLLLLSCATAYFISNLIKSQYYFKAEETEMTQEEVEQNMGYAEKLQVALNNAIANKEFVKTTSVEDLIKRNEAGDYSLSAALNILGNPVCVIESVDSFAITCYDEEKEIEKVLSEISTKNEYTKNSFIQMYWMKNTGEAIISWVALNEEDMSEVKIIGIITSQYQELVDISIPTAEDTQKIFNSLGMTKEEMLETYNPLIYRTQYKLLECEFTKNLMGNEEYKNTWSEYVLKNEDGYLHLNTKDDSFYLVYQEFDDVTKVPVYPEDKRIQLVDGTTTEKFLTLLPEAKLYETYMEDNSTYVTYAIRNSEEDTDLVYYNFKDDIITNPGAMQDVDVVVE